MRQSEETDVIQILELEDEREKEANVSKEVAEGCLSSAEVNPTIPPTSTTNSTTSVVEMETKCDLIQGSYVESTSSSVTLISTKQMFKPKNKTKRKSVTEKTVIMPAHEDDEDTVDLDLFNVKSCKRQKAEKNSTAATTNSQILDQNAAAAAVVLPEDKKENTTVTTTTTVASERTDIVVAAENAILSEGQKKYCDAKVTEVEEDSSNTSSSSKTPTVVKVSLFKNKQPKKRNRRASKKDQYNSKKKATGMHIAGYDSDSIDIDVLASYSARTFAQSTGISPPADSSSNLGMN